MGNVILTGIGKSEFWSGNHGTLNVRKDESKDMGAALQSEKVSRKKHQV